MPYKISFTVPVIAADFLSEVVSEFAEAVSICEAGSSEMWVVDAYFPEKPNTKLIKVMIFEGCKKLNIDAPKITSYRLKDINWTAKVQRDFKPVKAANFYIYSSWHDEIVDDNLIKIQIDPGQAFGTGQHETTKSCLELIAWLRDRNFLPNRIIDLGTGSGILAMAAARTWKSAELIASDIDPIAIDVARENALINNVSNLIEFKVCDGIKDGLDKQKYDLVIANILANPLIFLSEQIESVCKSGSYIILSGFDQEQGKAVQATYSNIGFSAETTFNCGNWQALCLKRM